MAESTTPYVILGFLAQDGALSGYEIRKRIALTVSHFWNESFGQLYPELQRLTKVGWIVPAADAHAARRRARFRITGAGRRALSAWLAQPARPEHVRSELLLRVFFADEGDHEGLRQALDDAIARWSADATSFAATERQLLVEDLELPQLVYSIATVRHGRWVRAARLRWARETLALLDLAERRGNRALLTRLKRLEADFP
jgi:DNA-binding PadR family transcriptional regulator